MSVSLSSELSIAELGIFEAGSIAFLGGSSTLSITPSDSLNNWLDSEDLYKYPLSYEFGDSLNSPWLDSILLSGISVSLTQTAADTLNVWSDAIGQIYHYLQSFNDTGDINDALLAREGHIIQAGDQFTLSETASIIPAICITFGDSAHNWLDLLVRIPNISLKEFSDNFLLTDELKTSFSHRLAVADLNTLSDAILLTFQFLLDNADQITQTDALNVQSNVLGALTLSVGETLEMSDSLGNTNNINNPLSSTAFINFLRRYLNDVPR